MDSPHRLPWSQRISFGVGHSLNDLTASVWFSYLIIYLQLVLGFDSTYAGIVLLVGQVVDAVATPLLGFEASGRKHNYLCQKYGPRKFLHLIGTILTVITFPFIFSACPWCERSSESALLIMIIPLVIIFQIGWAAVQVSHLSLIPAITPLESERDMLSVIRYAVDIVSDIVTYAVVWLVFDLTRIPNGSDRHTISSDYADKFTLIVIIILCIGSVFSIWFHIGLKEDTSSPFSSEDNSLEKENDYDERRRIHRLKQNNLSWRGWLREIHFYQIGFLYMFTRLFQNVSCVFMPLYLQESLKANDDFIAKIPLVMNVSGFVVSCILPKFFKIFNKKITFLLGATIGIGSCTWLSIGSGPSYCFYGIYGVGALMGAASSMLVVCGLSFIHDLIGTSIESGAFVYGCMSFWDKLANGVVGMLIQQFHSTMCVDCTWYYRNVMSYGVGCTAIAASVVVLTIFPVELGKRKSRHNAPLLFKEKPENGTYGSIENIDTSESLPDLVQERM